MNRIRFHIASLFTVIVVLAVAFAALRESNPIWDAITFTLTVGIVLISVLLAIHRTERRRAFWLGFALFGVAYLALSLIPPIESRLLTTKGLAFLNSKTPGSTSNGVGLVSADFDNDGMVDLLVANSSQPSALYRNLGDGTFKDVTMTVGLNYAGNQAGPWLVGTSENFKRIAHSLFALIAAFLGGRISRRLYIKNHERVQAIQSHGSLG